MVHARYILSYIGTIPNTYIVMTAYSLKKITRKLNLDDCTICTTL